MPTRRLTLLLFALALLAAPVLAAPAEAADYVQGQVIVKYRHGTSETARWATEQSSGTDAAQSLPGGSRQLRIEDGESVSQTVDQLRDNPDVAYAVPNYLAHASQWVPNDPAFGRQWNLFEQFGIGMPEAWTAAAAAGAPGGRGAVVAVLDSGVAYEHYRRFRRAPDLRRSSFVRGYDFIDRDRHPNDTLGHGTHVAGTIAEATNNREAAAGIAYGVKIMPLRVLNNAGYGDSFAIAKAIRYAARHHADVINLSLEFDLRVVAPEIPEILSAMRYAHRHGVVIVAAAGNKRGRRVAYPARAGDAIAVGATTRNGCKAEYSNAGPDLDVVAPGGGDDGAYTDNAWDRAHCRPDVFRHDWIFQQTFERERRVTRFGLPRGYDGTSMATPHVTAVAALIIATRRLGKHPAPSAVQRHIEATATDLGAPAFDSRYGWGLVNAANALR